MIDLEKSFLNYITVQPQRFRVELEVMAMESYSTLPKAPELEPHHQMQFSFIPRTQILFDPKMGP